MSIIVNVNFGTLPETSLVAPESGWLEDEPGSFWGLLVSGRVPFWSTNILHF